MTQLDAAPDNDLGPLPMLTNVTAVERDDSVGIDFDPVDNAVDYRVYVLVLPASRLAAGADRDTTTAIADLTTDAAKAQARVTPANQAALQPLIADLNGQIGAATNATNGLASTVLAFTPAQWNADNALLSASRSALETADAALQKGRADVSQIVQDLKGSQAPVVATTTTPTTTG